MSGWNFGYWVEQASCSCFPAGSTAVGRGDSGNTVALLSTQGRPTGVCPLFFIVELKAHRHPQQAWKPDSTDLSGP